MDASRSILCIPSSEGTHLFPSLALVFHFSVLRVLHYDAPPEDHLFRQPAWPPYASVMLRLLVWCRCRYRPRPLAAIILLLGLTLPRRPNCRGPPNRCGGSLSGLLLLRSLSRAILLPVVVHAPFHAPLLAVVPTSASACFA